MGPKQAGLTSLIGPTRASLVNPTRANLTGPSLPSPTIGTFPTSFVFFFINTTYFVYHFHPISLLISYFLSQIHSIFIIFSHFFNISFFFPLFFILHDIICDANQALVTPIIGILKNFGFNPPIE